MAAAALSCGFPFLQDGSESGLMRSKLAALQPPFSTEQGLVIGRMNPEEELIMSCSSSQPVGKAWIDPHGVIHAVEWPAL